MFFWKFSKNFCTQRPSQSDETLCGPGAFRAALGRRGSVAASAPRVPSKPPPPHAPRLPDASAIRSAPRATLAMDAAVYRKLHPRAYLKRFLTGASVRADGRAPDAARRATLTAGSVTSAVGSAMAKLGRTTAVAGVSATLVPPSPTSTDQAAGTLAVAVHVLPLAGGRAGSSGAGGGARNADVACLAAFVRENVAGHVDLGALCVEEGTLVWALKLTVYCVDHDGNVEDAMLLAATAALLNVRLPAVRMVDDLPEGDPDARPLCADDDGEDTGGDDASVATAAGAAADDKVLAVASADRTVRLNVSEVSLSVSFAVFDEYLLLDPNRAEEGVADARITLVLRSNGDLRAVHKPGGTAVAASAVGRCLPLAQKQVAALVKVLDLPPPPAE